MLSGQRFKLKTPTLGLSELPDGSRVAHTISAGTIIYVLSGPLVPEDRMVDVLCAGKRLTMFVTDVRDRGEPISDATQFADGRGSESP